MKEFKIVLSSTCDHYAEIVPITIFAWKKFFPCADIRLGLISASYPVLKTIQEQLKDLPVKLYSFISVPGIDIRVQSKLLRYFISISMIDDSICMINDIDLIPLQKDYYENILKHFELQSILAIGSETYKNGKFPIAYMTGTTLLLKNLFGDYKRFDLFLSNLQKTKMKIFDGKENIKNSFNEFSDESLIRSLIDLKKIPVKHINKTFKPGAQSITRHHELNVQKNYIEAHHLLPINDYSKKIMFIKKKLGMI